MKHNTIFRLILPALAMGTLVAAVVAAESRPRRTAMQSFMRQKLVYSQGVLEGLSLEKFDLVSKNAIRMRDMTQSNHWSIVRQPDYMAHTTNYQKSIEALYMAAVDKNLEAATDAYLKMARNCVECHRLVRADQRKNPEPPARTKP